MSDTNNEELIAAAEFIQREMLSGFLHPGVVANDSKAHKALTALVDAALVSRPPVPAETVDFEGLQVAPEMLPWLQRAMKLHGVPVTPTDDREGLIYERGYRDGLQAGDYHEGYEEGFKAAAAPATVLFRPTAVPNTEGQEA